MATYIILSRISTEAVNKLKDLKDLSDEVSEKIKKECPDVNWKESYATFGRFDIVDIVESDDPKQVARAALILRTAGHETTETLVATPWEDMLRNLQESGRVAMAT